MNHANYKTEVMLVVEYVVRLNVGATLTYEQLEKLVGWKSEKHQYQKLMSKARRVLDQEHGVLMSAVTNLGYQVLTDEQIVLYTAARTQSLRRTAERLISQLERCVGLDNLTATNRRLYAHCVKVLQKVAETIPVTKPAQAKAGAKAKADAHATI